MKPNVFTNELLEIKKAVEKEVGIIFTSCLANLYRNGHDSNGWHADNEKELGKRHIIASVTFGAERIFHFKHKKDNMLKAKINLKLNSIQSSKNQIIKKLVYYTDQR